MELKPFDIEVVQDRPVYILNYSEYYLQELCEKWPEILAYVMGAIDDVKARQGEHYFQGYRIEVRDYEAAKDISSDAILLILSSYMKEPYQKLLQIEGMDEKFQSVYFFVDREMVYDMYYRELYSKSSLENIIIFRSSGSSSHYLPTWDFADNARALFEYLLAHGYNQRYLLVWLVHDPSRYQEAYADYRNVEFLSYFDALSEDKETRDKYYRCLCLSKYVFFCQSGVFARNARKDQVRIQLWHGSGIKSQVPRMVDKDRYEYMIVSSEEYARLHMDYFGLKEEQLLITGLPKDDLLFHPVEDWKARLGIPKAQKYIMWLPTWRKAWFKTDTNQESETGLPVISTMNLLTKLNDFLAKRDIVLLIKLHPLQERENISCRSLSHVRMIENEDLATAGLQIEAVLGDIDALVSDYSSVAIGYALLDHPIAFAMDDMEEYKENRGFNWENVFDWLPGVIIQKFNDFIEFIEHVHDGTDESREKRRRLNRVFHKYLDGNNAKRVVEKIGI